MINRRLFLSVAAAAMFLPSGARAQDAEARDIFDGKTLNGWKGMDGIWKVEDGCLTGETTQPNQLKFNTFLVWQDGEVDDFELTFDYKLNGGNSGMQIRSYMKPDSTPEEFRLSGYQADLEAGESYSGIIYSEGERGILAERGQKTKVGADHKPVVTGSVGDKKELQSFIKQNEWNAYKITAKGNVITTTINGHQMTELVDEDAEKARPAGKLGLQLHVVPTPMKIQLKNVKLKRLPLADKKKVVFLAGNPSHGPGQHEHRAGCMLLASELNKQFGTKVLATVYTGGYPADPTAFDNADSVISFADGGGGHPLRMHLRQMDDVMKRGVGLGCLHYGVEILAGDQGGNQFLDWIGGFFEINWSVNPHWTADFKTFPEHDVTRGVKPFSTNDEWYYHMRFRPEMKGVTPILSALPPAETLNRGDGTHSGNPAVREAVAKGEAQHLMWVANREDGKGRGFGCTGSHYHKNWATEDYRRLILNAILWISKVDVPAEGFPVSHLSEDEMKVNLDPKK